MPSSYRIAASRLLGSAALVTLLSVPVLAQEAPEEIPEDETAGGDSGSINLGPIVITATRKATGVFDSLSGSSAVTSDDLKLKHTNAPLTEVITGIPGLSTQTSADDPGVAVNMRGLQDFGRVNVMVDGARQNFQKNGHEANGTFYMDAEMLNTVDVTRGPVSSVYGSGAIGGVVNFTTLNAEDIIRGDASSGARLRTSLSTNGFGPTVNAVAAARHGDIADFLIGGTFQTLEDYESGGGQSVNSAQTMKSGLIKGTLKPTEGHEIKLSASRYLNTFENGSTTTRDTDVTADTLTAGYRYTPDGSRFWDFTAKTYYTGTLFEQLQPGGGGLEQSFDVGTIGLDVFNTSRLTTGGFEHELTYGGDVFQDTVKTVDLIGSSDDLTPSGERLAYGAFVQDRVKYGSWLEIIGALRYDGYRLEGDGIEVEGERLSPKITVGITPWTPLTVYATYAEGYRAPAITETLIDGFHPPPVVGRFFPNPDLRPEVAHTIEAGVNLRFTDLFTSDDRFAAKIGVYENNVDDYIDQVFVMFPIPGGYQYQNIAEARIRGVEVEASYDSGRFFASIAGQVMEGENRTDGTALQKVPPYRVVATAGFRAMDEKLTLGARLTVVGEKDDAPITGFIGESYETLDIFGSYQFNDRITGNVALNNVFNRDYTQYLNADPSPGFNAKASVTINF